VEVSNKTDSEWVKTEPLEEKEHPRMMLTRRGADKRMRGAARVVI
jgi:hypothetical protein